MLSVNKIYCGDAYELIKQLDDKSVDLVLTDPPYEFGAKGGGFYNSENKDKRTYLDTLEENDCTEFDPKILLDECKRVLKVFNGVFFCNKSLVANYLNWAIANNYTFDIHFMTKDNPIPAKNNHFLHDVEYIILIREKGSYFNSDYPVADYHKVFKTTSKSDNVHPAQKPVKLMQKYIKILSSGGGTILDPFMGSCTTAVACKNLGRNYIGFEISEEYVKIGNKRLAQNNLTNFFGGD